MSDPQAVPPPDVVQGVPDEQHVIARAVAGDHEAFATLYTYYSSAVYTHVLYRLGNASEAEDAVQEIFVRAYLKLHTFDQSRALRPWLLRVASNYCTDLLRRRISLRRLFLPVPLDDVAYELRDPAASPERSALHNERRAMVRQALQDVPDTYREVLILFYWNDLSYPEIRAVTGLNDNTLKTRLRRGREHLARALQARGLDASLLAMDASEQPGGVA